MKAWQMTGYGAVADRLRWLETERPVASHGQVVVRVEAASLNPIDYKIVAGSLRRFDRYDMPHGIGFDVAGSVEECGPGSTFRPGDRVFARLPRQHIGALSECVCIRDEHTALIPAGVSFAAAASLPLVGLTSVQALVDRARVQSGQAILIHAGSGGLGSFAIQFARHLGLTVTSTTSSRNAEFVATLGAHRVIAYDREDYRQSGAVFDVVFDTLGGEHTLDAFSVLKRGGTVVSVAGPPDRDFGRAVGAGPLIRLAMWGMSRKIYSRAAQAKASYFRFLTESSGRQLVDVGRLVEQGAIKPVIDRSFAMADVLEAFAYLQTGRARGKVVIEAGGPA